MCWLRSMKRREPGSCVKTPTVTRRRMSSPTRLCGERCTRARVALVARSFHARAAEVIISTVGRDDRSLPSLASHYRLAGTAADPDQAADVLLDAAALVSRGWAKAEAAELYAAALELLPESANERRRLAMLQRSVNLQAAWHARFDHHSIEAVTGAPPESAQEA